MTHSGDRENLPRFTELDGDYEILRELGRGGTAVVYLAHERVLSRLVAIKVIRSTYVEDEEAVARLMREARTVGGMQHPNIVVLYGTRRLGDGSLALIMQYIPGRTLRKEIQTCGGLPFERVHRILTDVGRALAHAHRQSIVHRDVKPENIYVEEESGMARLSDFGIARAWDVDSELTLPGTAIGTPAYMSPEQIDGGEVDGRSDLFSLGLVGYEMLTGTRPWAGESLYSVIAKQKNTQLPSLKERRPGIPAALQLAIDGALRKDREARWQTANEFLTALGSPPDAERVEEPASPFAELISVEQTPWAAAAAPAAATPSTSHRDNETMVWRPPVAPPLPPAPTASATAESPASETIITPPPAAVKTRKRTDASHRRVAMLIGAAALVVVTLATAAVSMTTGQDSPETAVADDDAVRAAPVPESAADPAPPPAAEITEDAPPPPAADVTPHTVSARAALLYAVFGDGQQGPAGVALGKPLMVRVVDAGGRAVEGATVHFTVTTGAGSVQPTMAVTNRDGVAATRWVPRTVGVHRAQARVDGMGGVIAFSARALPGPKASPRRSNVARREPVRQPPVRRRDTSAAATLRSTTPFTGASNLSRSTRAPSTLGAAPTGLTVRREVAAGGRHSCTLNGTGLAICWGSGDAGQLGGRPVGPAAAVHVTTEEPFTMLAAGATHTCAIAGSGRAFCWGGNGAGQLGDGTRVSRAVPERVRLTDRLTSITVGLQHTCAIDSTGQISCWGQNNRGQLGDRTKADRALAVRVAGRGTFRNVAAGWTHTCAIGTDGTAYCWGSNRFGELGDSDGSDHAAPTAVAGGHRFSSIAAGNGFSCGLRTDGAVLCWGDNTHGQLGNGTTSLSVMPVEILAATRFTDIAAGAAHACAVSWDGTAYCWGQNDYGQLGDGTMQDRLSPTVVVGGHRFSAISASAAHSCATATNGRSLCWGSNRDGQVGDVPRNVQTRPVPSAN